jgi:hypothetical protein
MAIEINNANAWFGESVHLDGDDASRFVKEIERPSTDERRLSHLRRSDEAFKRFWSDEPITELTTDG